jgi:hypothetical protein
MDLFISMILKISQAVKIIELARNIHWLRYFMQHFTKGDMASETTYKYRSRLALSAAFADRLTGA